MSYFVRSLSLFVRPLARSFVLYALRHEAQKASTLALYPALPGATPPASSQLVHPFLCALLFYSLTLPGLSLSCMFFFFRQSANPTPPMQYSQLLPNATQDRNKILQDSSKLHDTEPVWAVYLVLLAFSRSSNPKFSLSRRVAWHFKDETGQVPPGWECCVTGGKIMWQAIREFRLFLLCFIRKPDHVLLLVLQNVLY